MDQAYRLPVRDLTDYRPGHSASGERRVVLSGGRNEKTNMLFQMQLAMLRAARHFGGEVDPRTTQNAARRSVLFEIASAPLKMAGRELSREEKEVII